MSPGPFILPGAIAFAFCLYTFLVWRERRAMAARLAPPQGKMSAYRGALPEAKKTYASSSLAMTAAAAGTFAFFFLVPFELVLDRAAAFIARGMSRKGAVPLPFVPSWRVGAALRAGKQEAENAVDRLHRLQVVVNCALFAMLFLCAHALAGSPALFGLLFGVMVVRSLHTRLLGKIARTFQRGVPEDLAPAQQKDEGEDVPPWLSRALTRRAENRLGAAPLGSARPVRPAREERVRISDETKTDAPGESEEPEPRTAPLLVDEREHEHEHEHEPLNEPKPRAARRTIG